MDRQTDITKLIVAFRNFANASKISDVKFHENPSSVPCGQMDRQTDITNLIVAFRNFANARKNSHKPYLRATHF